MKNNHIMNIAILDLDSLKNHFWAAGQARATREIGKRLAKKHEVTVYTSKFLDYKDYKEDGITYKHIGIANNNPLITNLGYIASIPFVVPRVKADIIIECFTAPISTLYSQLFTKIPVIGLPTMFNAEEFAKKYHLPFHWIERFGLRFYKYLMPYSNVDSAKAKQLNPNIICKIIPQGVGKEYFRIKQRTPKHILFLGRYDIAQKGINLLLHAYATVADKITYPLVIAGHGTDEKKIRKLISKLHLKNKVRMVGSAYKEKKFKLMSEALFVAFPSKHEEMSLWSLESLAAGLPLVCFDLPESKWLPETVALKAAPFDVKEYSKLLLKATNAPSLKKMRIDSREFARQFTWENVAQEFESFLQEVIVRERKTS